MIEVDPEPSLFVLVVYLYSQQCNAPVTGPLKVTKNDVAPNFKQLKLSFLVEVVCKFATQL